MSAGAGPEGKMAAEREPPPLGETRPADLEELEDGEDLFTSTVSTLEVRRARPPLHALLAWPAWRPPGLSYPPLLYPPLPIRPPVLRSFPGPLASARAPSLLPGPPPRPAAADPASGRGPTARLCFGSSVLP